MYYAIKMERRTPLLSQGTTLTSLLVESKGTTNILEVYFRTSVEAMLAMFHPSLQEWLVVNGHDSELYLTTVTVSDDIDSPQFDKSQNLNYVSEGTMDNVAIVQECLQAGWTGILVRVPIVLRIRQVAQRLGFELDLDDFEDTLTGYIICNRAILAQRDVYRINQEAFLGNFRFTLMKRLKAGAIDLPTILKLMESRFISTGENPFANMPPELIRLTALQMSLHDINSMCQTSIQFNDQICDSEIFWQEKVRLDFPDKVTAKPRSRSWNEYYQRLSPLADDSIVLYYNVAMRYRPTSPVEIRKLIIGKNVIYGSMTTNLGNAKRIYAKIPSAKENQRIHDALSKYRTTVYLMMIENHPETISFCLNRLQADWDGYRSLTPLFNFLYKKSVRIYADVEFVIESLVDLRKLIVDRMDGLSAMEVFADGVKYTILKIRINK